MKPLKNKHSVRYLWIGGICFICFLFIGCEKKRHRYRHHSSETSNTPTEELKTSTHPKTSQSQTKAPAIEDTRTLPPLITQGMNLEVSSTVSGTLEVLDAKDEVLMHATGKRPQLRCQIPASSKHYKINFEPADQSMGTQRMFLIDPQLKKTSIQISLNNSSQSSWIFKRQHTPPQKPSTLAKNHHTKNAPNNPAAQSTNPTNNTQKETTAKQNHQSASAKKKNPQRQVALEHLKIQAEIGDTESQFILGRYYYIGDNGVEKDIPLAFQWFEKAANKGHARAQHFLGLRYQYALAAKENPRLAYQWFLKSATQGYSDAQYYVAKCYQRGYGVEKNIASALRWYQKSATQGDADAQLSLGFCHYQGGSGVPKDLVKATHWFELSAKQGNASAQYDLGRCYYFGEGRQKDLTLAFQWYEKAAKQGDASAQNALGQMYFSGEGTLKDPREAKKWLKLAFKNGNKNAEKFWNLNELWKVE